MKADGGVMAKGDDIQERLIAFGIDVIDLCDELPRTLVGRHIADQLLHSGTSPAPNYAEARAAESRRDFAHKLGIVFKELKESAIWLETIRRRGMLPPSRLGTVQRECDELCRIAATSLRTLREK
jgi:four helix bundle protein